MMVDTDDRKGGKWKCAECERELDMGEEALTLELVVIGPRGPVPLEEMLFFHRGKCFQQYVSDDGDGRFPMRIP